MKTTTFSIPCRRIRVSVRYAESQGLGQIEKVFLRAIAAGTAAVLHPGTELCRIEDVERLLVELKGSPQ